MNRKLIFIFTFLTYAIVHMMRTTYSFNKNTLQKRFHISQLYLGVLDSLIFLSLALGTFFRYSILNDSKPALTCLKTAIPTSIAFAVVPIYSLIMGKDIESQATLLTYILMGVSFGVFGFFQLSFFPATLTIFSQCFNVKDDGSAVGVWSSKSNAGNIMGFLIANLLVYELDVKWEYTMLICSVLLIIVTIGQYKVVENLQDNSQKISTTEFFKFMKEKWSQTEFKLYILSFSFFKAILYSYEFWTPKFLSDVGFKQFSGYVPMVFDVSTLFGSFAMGQLYKDYGDMSGSKKVLLQFTMKYKFFIPSLLVILASLCYIFLPSSLSIYFILGASMGLFLGAIYNSLQNNQILSYTQNHPRSTDMFSTINIGIGCTMVGFFQFVIGVIMNIGQAKYQDNQFVKKGLIYIVIAGMGLIASGLTFARLFYYKQRGSNQNNQSTVIAKQPLLISD